jgi:hypothetical protein
LAALPKWLVTNRTIERNDEGTIPEGRRNSYLTSYAGRMRRQGFPPEGIEDALRVENNLRCYPPLPDEEVATIARSVCRYPPGDSIGASPTHSVTPNPEHPPWRCSIDLVQDAPEETEWLIQDVVPAESSVLTVAREGTYKTWLSLDFAKSVAEGIPWLGHDCQAGGVLYLDAENPGPNFRQRLHAVGASLNLHVWRWQDPSFPISLSDPWLKEAGKRFRLIVIDTLKRFTGNRDENMLTIWPRSRNSYGS